MCQYVTGRYPSDDVLGIFPYVVNPGTYYYSGENEHAFAEDFIDVSQRPVLTKVTGVVFHYVLIEIIIRRESPVALEQAVYDNAQPYNPQCR